MTDSLTSDVQQLREYHKALDQLQPLLQRLDEASLGGAPEGGEREGGAPVQCDDLEGLLDMLTGNKAGVGQFGKRE